MRGLTEFLRRHRRIALDTSVFIYHIEPNPRYVPLTLPIFAWISGPAGDAITSTITMTELLVVPYRTGPGETVDEFYGRLITFPNLKWIAPGLEIAEIAARLRASYRLRTPDALQAATALHSGATGMITNDAAFGRVREFESLILEKLL